MKVPLLSALALGLLLNSCGRPADIVPPVAEVPATLELTPAQARVHAGDELPVRLRIRNGEPSTQYTVKLVGVSGVAAHQQQLTLKTDAQGQAVADLLATTQAKLGGTAALIASGTGDLESASLYLNFQQGDAVVTTPQQIEASYPHLVGPNMGAGSTGLRPSSLTPLVTQPQKVDAPLPDVAVVDDVQYLNPNGRLSEPMDGVQYRVPNTGSGQPSEADLKEGTGPTMGAQYACGTQNVTVYFTNVIDGVSTPITKGTYIRASEQNSLTDSIQAEGYIGDNGAFTFPMQICDTGNWFTRDAPDLYFILETNNVPVGLTETHGTFARRHWWRTSTWWNTSPGAMNGMTVQVSGANAEAELARRLWHKVNEVYNWNRSAMGDKYSSFPLDVLYPVSTYFGVAKVSRAAIRQMQIVDGDAVVDATIHHEFGHEVYYRQLLGEAQWATYNTATGVAFPTCGGCMNHNFDMEIGPEAAMVEGWADFFAAVTTRALSANSSDAGLVENPDLWTQYYPTSIPSGLGNELRVAAYLYDLYDTNADHAYLSRGDDDTYQPSGTPQQRYRNVAGYFFNASLSSELQHHWTQRIKPTLTSDGLAAHCTLLRLNTLSSIDAACAPQ